MQQETRQVIYIQITEYSGTSGQENDRRSVCLDIALYYYAGTEIWQPTCKVFGT